MKEHGIYDKPNLRKTVEGILYRMRTESPGETCHLFSVDGFRYTNNLIVIIREKNSTPIIPRKSNLTIGNNDMDWGLYKCRHLVENVFARIKHFRAVATRYDKLKRNYASMVAIACGFMWLPL